MVFNTLSVGAAITPSVIETYFSHYLNRAPLRQKPTAHISYHEGLRLIRQFLDHSAKHTIEDIQGFTGQWVPAPIWVRINDAEVAPKFLERAARLLYAQLGHRGLRIVGGKTWWQWRRPDQPLRAEWIEMKKEYIERKRTGERCERVILYVHGGAYYFGSVDEHRYQMQRHARKLRARVLAPRYRLAPQFPFPCALYDCLATYFYLLEHFDPSQILFMGDSAGGGMVLSMLVALRDQGQPLPAGTILLSPWCDLTHSFPSVAGDGTGDYIPPHGFHHRPSMAWPPPPSDGVNKASGSHGQPSDAVELPATAGLDMKKKRKKPSVDDGIDDDDDDDEYVSGLAQSKSREEPSIAASPVPLFGQPLSMMVDGRQVDLRDQIQMYTTNELLAHPLVSPVMQPSLGGLPPMLIQVGGAELLRDEQIYLAHKAANPSAFPPNETIMKEFDPSRKAIDQYPPTLVQLQVWDDLCHVPHTLSFTRPAKYMYRSVAQFGAWALSHAQHKGIDIQNDDALSFISSGGEEDDDDAKSMIGSVRRERPERKSKQAELQEDAGAVGKAGDPLPAFKDHMIRQRVTRHGNIFPLPPQAEIACLALDPATIGVPKTGPVRKWLAVRSANEPRFANERKKVQKRRDKETAAGYDEIPGESPPPTALVNRRRKGVAPEEKKRGKSWGLAMWSGWGSSHDEHTLQREQKTLERKLTLESGAGPSNAGAQSSSDLLTVPTSGSRKPRKRRNSSVSMLTAQMPWAAKDKQRPMSPYSQVNDTGQATESYSSPVLSRGPFSTRRRPSTDTSTTPISRPASASAVESPIPVDSRDGNDAPIPAISTALPDSEKIPGAENTYLSPSSTRPHNGVQAYPFKLKDERSNPSVVTLDSQAPSGVSTPHSELVGDAPKSVELSGEKRSMTNLRADADAAAAAAAVESGPVTSSEDQKPLEQRPETLEDLVSPVEPQAQVVPGKEDPISPVEVPRETAEPFNSRRNIFDPRVSMLGSIGADGMPNAHHEFPIRRTTTADVEPAVPSLEPKADSADENAQSRSASLEAGGKAAAAAPFKLRNPVHDSRAPATSSGATSTETSTPPRDIVKPSESTRAAPFKLRHTYDPTAVGAKPSSSSDNDASIPAIPATSPTPPSTAPATEKPRSISSDNAPEVLPLRSSDSSMGTEPPPPAYDSMPVTTVTLPETLAGTRPVALKEKTSSADGYDDDRPPTPPPKDDKPYIPTSTNGSGRKERERERRSKKQRPTEGMGSRKTSGTGRHESAGAGKTAPPVIGELGFESERGKEGRPGLESFVTASEGRDLKGV